jgi:enhancing lycopene biosynthesis protein 2
MIKKIFILLAVSILFQMGVISETAKTVEKKIKIGVILSGSGIMDGTEIYEAAFTILALENTGAEIIMMAPNVMQATVVNHLKNDEKVTEQRNVLIESARIARGNIKDIKDVKATDIDALIIPGGMGALLTLSDIMSKGAGCTINPEVERIIKDVYSAKKPIGSMCAASLIVAKVLGNKIKITIGKNNDYFGPMIAGFGAVHVESTGDNMVIDDANKIVTTPAFMAGPSNSVMFIGIEKMVKQVVKFVKK